MVKEIISLMQIAKCNRIKGDGSKDSFKEKEYANGKMELYIKGNI